MSQPTRVIYPLEMQNPGIVVMRQVKPRNIRSFQVVNRTTKITVNCWLDKPAIGPPDYTVGYQGNPLQSSPNQITPCRHTDYITFTFTPSDGTTYDGSVYLHVDPMNAAAPL